jgi:HEAT repeat protein
VSAKRLRILVCLALIWLSGARWLSPSAVAAETLVYHATMEAAYAAAAQDDTLVLLIFRAGWCRFSETFEKMTLASTEVNTGAPPLQVYMADVEVQRKLAEEYRVDFLPYLVLLNREGKIIAQDKGIPAPDEFIAWIHEGNRKDLQGEWEGYSPSGTLGRFLEIFRSGNPKEADYRKLVAMLGAGQPADRILAAQIVLDLGAPVIGYLIQAAGNEYLGLRVGAVGMLDRMLPSAPKVDPWAPKVARQTAVARLTAWWETRKRDVFVKAPVTTAEALKGLKEFNAAIPYDRQAIQKAFKELRSRNAVKRTAAMTYLVEQGAQTLPVLRTHLTVAEDRNDHDFVRQLNEVRWAILVSPQIVSKMPAIRMTLTRGTIHQRIHLIERLIAMGDTALPVLAELVHDGEPLIQEAALQGLARIRSRTAIVQMATLLESDNPNLRMVTAQMLGRTKNMLAAAYLEKALDDVDEVVVVTALASLEELKAGDASEAIIRKMTDGRWRVRAAAAETAGKLKLNITESHLRELLDDADPFVVKSALVALAELKTPLTAENVERIAARHADLIPELIRQIHRRVSAPLINVLGKVFANAPIDHQRRIIETLSDLEARETDDPFVWRPFFDIATAAPRGEIRRLAVNALGAGSPELHFDLLPIGRTQPEMEKPAHQDSLWSAALALLCHHYGYSEPYKSGDYCLMCPPDESDPSAISEMEDRARLPDPEKEKRRAALTARYDKWHRLLEQDPRREGDLTRTLLYFFTSPAASLPENLSAAMTEEALFALLERPYGSFCLQMLLARIDKERDFSWLAAMTASPDKYIPLLLHAQKAPEEVQAFLRSPERLGHFLETLEATKAAGIIRAMLAQEDSYLSLFANPDWAKKMCSRFKMSKAGHLRILGLYTCRDDEGPEGSLAAVLPLLKDEDPWLRKAAVVVVAKREPNLKRREELLAPLIEDPHPRVAAAAVCGLLEDRVRKKARLSDALQHYQYDSLEAYMPGEPFSYGEEDLRPLTPLNRRPDFLPLLWRYYRNRASAAGEDATAAAILLMAQYGDVRAFNHYLEHTERKHVQLTDAMLAVIQLRRDPDDLDFLRMQARQMTSEYRLAEVLEAVRTVKGPEARRFRREINQMGRRLRRRE